MFLERTYIIWRATWYPWLETDLLICHLCWLVAIVIALVPGKFHHDRSLFSRSLESWFFRNHPRWPTFQAIVSYYEFLSFAQVMCPDILHRITPSYQGLVNVPFLGYWTPPFNDFNGHYRWYTSWPWVPWVPSPGRAWWMRSRGSWPGHGQGPWGHGNERQRPRTPGVFRFGWRHPWNSATADAKEAAYGRVARISVATWLATMGFMII